MRFAIATITLLLAGVLVALGIAQRTVLKPADEVGATVHAASGASYLVVPGSVLTSHPGRQQVHLRGDGRVFAAYGHSADVMAWLAGERIDVARTGADGALTTAARTAPAVAGIDGGSPDPDGADLWLDQASGTGRLDWTVNVPSDVSLLIASDGSAAAPADVRLTWRSRAVTPFAVPMIIGGGALAALGLVLYVWALVHVRRRRGPRRKPPAKVRHAPPPPRYRPQRPTAVAAERGRRSVRSLVAHRPLVALTGLATAGALLTGCSAQAAPAAPSPSVSATGAPAITASVTEEQAARIVRRAADVAAKADAKRDADLLAERFAGPALQLRRAAYAIRKKDKKAELPQALPTGDARLRLILPEATSTWPRTLFAVVEDRSDDTVRPLALTLVQDDPRADYTVRYASALQPKAKLPDLPSAVTGATRLGADAAVLRVTPAALAKDYGLLLRKPGSATASLFDTSADELVAGVGKTAKDKAVKRLGSTASIAFSDLAIDPASVVALSTAKAGALVSVQLEEKWTVKPKRSGVTVKPSGGTRILSKTGASTKGIASVYGYQLLFSVPSAGSTKPVVLLGYAQGLVSAKEL